MKKNLTIRMTDQAQCDGDEQMAWILKNSEDAARRFWGAVMATCSDLAEEPGMGSLYECDNPLLEGMRKKAVKGFPNHLIFYRVEGNVLRVLRIQHGARDLPKSLRWDVNEDVAAYGGEDVSEYPDFGPPPGVFSITPQTTKAQLEAELLKGLL